MADTLNHTIRKVTSDGTVGTVAGKAGMIGRMNGVGAAALFSSPFSIALDGAGNLYVADRDNHVIRRIDGSQAVTTFAGTTGVPPGHADGPAATATFGLVTGVTIDSTGYMYVVDSTNDTIRGINQGLVTTVAGAATVPGGVDGTGTSARFRQPSDVAVDAQGNVYVADRNNHTIRKISDGAVTTLAGLALMPGSTDGQGKDARFDSPNSVAVDSAGNVYVADTGNATIRRITPDGVTTTLAGSAGVKGVILGKTPRFANPRNLVVVDDALVISDAHALLVLHGVVPDAKR